MAAVAEARGAQSTSLITRAATCDAVVREIARAAEDLAAGDLFLLTYSGHGGQVPDVNDEESDDLDETWCLFDSQLRDDDINACLALFAEGVRVLMLSDSCHSGSVNKDLAFARDSRLGGRSPAPKRLPLESTDKEFQLHLANYRTRLGCSKTAIKATGALISGCRDDQESKDGDVNGAFTSAFLTAWDKGRFAGDHRQLHESIVNILWERHFEQEPQITGISDDDVSFAQFLAQPPLRP